MSASFGSPFRKPNDKILRVSLLPFSSPSLLFNIRFSCESVRCEVSMIKSAFLQIPDNSCLSIFIPSITGKPSERGCLRRVSVKRLISVSLSQSKNTIDTERLVEVT